MNNNWKYYIGIVFVALLFVLANSVYIVIRPNRQLSCSSASRCGWSRSRG